MIVYLDKTKSTLDLNSGNLTNMQPKDFNRNKSMSQFNLENPHSDSMQLYNNQNNSMYLQPNQVQPNE